MGGMQDERVKNLFLMGRMQDERVKNLFLMGRMQDERAKDSFPYGRTVERWGAIYNVLELFKAVIKKRGNNNGRK